MPELLLGPLLRYAGATEATVWVKTDAPCSVEVLGHATRTFTVAGHHFALVGIEGLSPGGEVPYEVGSRWSFHRDFGGVRLVMIDSRAGRVLDPDARSMVDEAEWRWIEDTATGGHDDLLLGTSLLPDGPGLETVLERDLGQRAD